MLIIIKKGIFMKVKSKNSVIILLTIFCIMLVIIPEYLSAENNILINKNQKNNLNFYVSFSEEDFQFDTYLDFTTINYNDGGQLNEIGQPMLPIKNILLALPEQFKATNIEIVIISEKEIPGEYVIYPAQPLQTLNDLSTNNKITHYNSQTYKSTTKYPEKSVELIRQGDLAGQSIAVVSIYPIHYIPKLNSLKLIEEIEFKILGTYDYQYKDFLPDSISEDSQKMYEKTIKEMVVNPKNVELQNGNEVYQRNLIDEGNYDYVIITNSSWVTAFQPLADWKTKKGIPAKIVTTDWIYDNYNGTNKEKIRSFIQDAHINWGSLYFLLGGDTDYIPYHSAYYLGDNIPSDTYYSDYDDDWMCEVHIGRASVFQVGNGIGGIGNFVNKSLNYEKNPPLTDFAKNVSLFGFDLDSITDGEDCKIDIDDTYIPSNWTVTEVYDSDTGNHEDMVDIAVNNGQNIINHIDHCNQNYMGTGYTNHNWGLTNSEVDAFSNGNKQSTWYSIGCWASAFDYDNCIAEHFVRDNDGGGIAYIGNTRYGWYAVGYDDYASLRYDRYFFKSFFDENHYKLGDLFSDHKMDAYNSMDEDNYNKYIFTELSLLGDPELPLWKENPMSLNVTYPEELPTNTSSFTVHVENSEGTDIQNAYVCLFKENEVYITGYTDSNGNVTLNPSPLTVGIMDVTVTKQNYIPFEGDSEVVLSNYPPYQPSDPHPENGSTGVTINTYLSWTGGDPDDDPVTYDVYFGLINPPPLVSANQTGTSYDLFTLEYNTTYLWKIVAWDNSSETNQSPLWTFTTEKITNNPPYVPSNPNPENASTNVEINSDISWTGGDPDGDDVTYDVYFSDMNPPIKVADNQSENNYELGLLNINTTYYWQIVTWDTEGVYTKGPIWHFTTEGNTPPNKPDISGTTSGSIGVSYEYTFVTTDPNNDNIYYYIKWGDGQEEEWIGPYASGEEVKLSHTWTEARSYVISAKTKDIHEANSQWGSLEIVMPKNKLNLFNFKIIDWLLDRYPNLFPILNLIFR
jgi:hypothetical protein